MGPVNQPTIQLIQTFHRTIQSSTQNDSNDFPAFSSPDPSYFSGFNPLKTQ